ncbi:hypothetical protein [Roseofilum capinflatum]|uniref:Uncharacterized protein n=1 Tax=Roseofilum capinflatum BLCC-M114 TaxID=3022440 RepID=A0ABT7B6B3_9CYAN|nr:hypothetical protein [Roseofilum capinflatum]MDJ1174699.1 hypothetical protein [Roseofilum capinflatum BLCC-M114]
MKRNFFENMQTFDATNEDEFTVVDFDGVHYMLRNEYLSNLAKSKGFLQPKTQEEQILAVALGIPICGNLVSVKSTKPLAIGSKVRGRLSGDPKKLALTKSYPEFIET